MLLAGLGKKKPAAEIVIAMGPRKPFKDRQEKGYSEDYKSNSKVEKDYSEFDALAEEMLSAIDKKDPGMLASTFKAFASMFKPNFDEKMDDEMEDKEY